MEGQSEDDRFVDCRMQRCVALKVFIVVAYITGSGLLHNIQSMLGAT